MTRQVLNPLSSAANDKLGDTPNTYTVKLNGMTLELYTATATNATALIAQAAAILENTNLITGFTKTYWFDANDTATATTPISHTGGATGTYLTNNAIGSSTTSHNPDSNAALWNPSTNKFDFTSLKIGDTVEFRIDLTIANAAAQEVNLFMSLGEGTAPYELPMVHNYYKTAATGTPFGAIFKIYIGDAATRDGGARFRFVSVAAATIKVNGWFYEITDV